MKASIGKIKALGVVRSSLGYIRVGNYENLSPLHKEALQKLIAADGYITAESYPNQDERFKKWP